jgi:sRNA-binding regulator protein Hfq
MMMNESLMSINERYNLILDKMDAIRANIHLISADELETAMKEMDKYEVILKQLEDLYPEEVSGRPI